MGAALPVGGQPSPELTAQDIEVRRARLFDFWRWACGYPERTAVLDSDPRYRIVTEGRDFGAGYSSCADLAHGGHEHIGNRRPWVNRGAAWQRGVNVWRIVDQCEHWRREVAPGDVLVTANDTVRGSDAHVVCVLQLIDGVLRTAEYGQPGGALRSYPFGDTIKGKRIRWRLPFEAELRRAFLAGQLGDVLPDPTI